MLIDSHCHLDRLNLGNYDDNLANAIDAAYNAGVEKMLCVGISVENREAVVDIASTYDSVVCSVGVHPLDVKQGLASFEDLITWGQHKKVVALGETGLDYYYSRDDAELQQESFIVHLKAAADAQLPVIVHTRDARADTIDLIKRYGSIESAGVLHCFTESAEMAKQAIDLNYYISFSGIVTFKNANELRDVVKSVPLERILIETDSPYLAPVPHRGKPNEPKYVRFVAECVADIKNISTDELISATSDNFFSLFKKAQS